MRPTFSFGLTDIVSLYDIVFTGNNDDNGNRVKPAMKSGLEKLVKT